QVTRSLELLRQVGAPLIGMVLNGVGDQAGYGYHGYYGQTAADMPASLRRRKAGPENGLAREA
nr:hypothetical protein [Actinomycetota bacterium]